MNQFIRSKVKEIVWADIFQKTFLEPIEVVLKTHSTTNQSFSYGDDTEKEQPVKQGELAQGLKIVNRLSIQDNKYESLERFSPIDFRDNITFQDMRNKFQNNLLSALIPLNKTENIDTIYKKPRQFQIAMCICMYNQDRKLLKNTLSGVGENIDRLIKSGIHPDAIAVFIILDGIQKTDSSIVQYINELEQQCSIKLGQEDHGYTFKDIKEISADDLIKREYSNKNKILYRPLELQERTKKRFCERKRQYQSIKKLIKQIQGYKNNVNIPYEQLDQRLKVLFLKEARKDYEQKNNDEERTDQQLLQEYAENSKRSKKILINTLSSGKQFCKQYIKARDDTAYLGSFRTGVYLSNEENMDGKNQIQEETQEERLKKNKEEEKRKGQIDEQESQIIKMNLFFCVKYKNSGKLSSHNWFFNGFCQQLRPQYTFLIDVGLRPHKQALFKMYWHMKNHPNVGGVCGYMALKTQKVEQNQRIPPSQLDCVTNISELLVDIQKAQQMEYHFAHLLDKPFQAWFKFIHVLPGAFSGYNYKSIRPERKVRGPDEDEEQIEDPDRILKGYFKSIDENIKGGKVQYPQMTSTQVLMRIILPEVIYSCIYGELSESSAEQMLYNQNIYLAEDRILCMGIHQNYYDMVFLPDAYAQVDPVKTLHGLLGQRKRWINGSFFAFDKVKKQLSRAKRCQPCLQFQIFFLTFVNILSYISPSLFLFTLTVGMQVFQNRALKPLFSDFINEESAFYDAFPITISFFYVVLFARIIFYSMHLTNRDQNFIPYIYLMATAIGVISIIIFIILMVDLIQGLQGEQTLNVSGVRQISSGQILIEVLTIILILLVTIYTLSILIYSMLFQRFSVLVDIIVDTFSFIFYSASYLILLNIYALARIDDISWGTKGLDSSSSGHNAQLKQTWKSIKIIYVGKFLFWNIIASVVLLSLSYLDVLRFVVTFIIVLLLLLTISVKMFIGTLYLLWYKMFTVNQPVKTYKASKYHQTIKSGLHRFFKQKLYHRIKDEIVEEAIVEALQLYSMPIQKRHNISAIMFEHKSKIVSKQMKKKKTERQSKIIERQSKINMSKRQQKSKGQMANGNQIKKKESFSMNIIEPSDNLIEQKNSENNLVSPNNTKTNGEKNFKKNSKKNGDAESISNGASSGSKINISKLRKER